MANRESQEAVTKSFRTYLTQVAPLLSSTRSLNRSSVTTFCATYFLYFGGAAKEVVGPFVGASAALRTRDDVSFVSFTFIDISNRASAAPPSPSPLPSHSITPAEENTKPTAPPPAAFALFSSTTVASLPARMGRVWRDIIGFGVKACLANSASMLGETATGAGGGGDSFAHFGDRVSGVSGSMVVSFERERVEIVALLASSAISPALRFDPLIILSP
ncbi:hypothetical protein BDN71DRAFT_1513135 [Pleurotus eryngii]|uniref:Uncharacterized protein n=1 Tax=Pleurotus eryngii TaxID=5323 RepID=A0A9P6D141_PLEER|nr:hypothetical protein BDN71DRAFT_1513135 [Pleurotus eryngii]